MSHAKYSPSAAHRWMACPGSLKRTQALPNLDSTYAMEGTLAHTLLDWCLVNSEAPAKLLGQAMAEVDPASNVAAEDQPLIIDQDMVDAVTVTLEYIETKWNELTNPTLFSETLVKIADDCEGTADVILMSLEDHYLEVIDFKYGKGHAVEIQDNEQLLTYAVGAVNMVDEAAEGDPLRFSTVRTTIVQPRGFHSEGPIRSAHYGQGQIDAWRAEVLDAITAEMESDDTVLVPGEKQCQWCPAKEVCQVRLDWKARSTFTTLEGFGGAASTDDLWSTPIEQLTTTQLQDILDNADSLIDRINQVRTHQMERIMAGDSDLGYKVIRGQSKRTFKLEMDETLDVLNKRLKFKKADITRQQLQTIGHLDKLAKAKGLNEAQQGLYDELFIKPEGKLQLAHQSEKGRAIEPVSKVFNPVTQPEVEPSGFDFLN